MGDTSEKTTESEDKGASQMAESQPGTHAQNPRFEGQHCKYKTPWCVPVIPAPGRLEAEGSEGQGHYQLHSEFEANMGYRDLKEKLTNKQNLLLSWKMKNLVRGTNSVIETTWRV